MSATIKQEIDEEWMKVESTKQPDSKSIDIIELIFAADTTGSMRDPIRYGKKIIDAVVSYIAGIVDSGQFTTLEVVIHVVGMNDWKNHMQGFTPPAKLFLNEDESIKQKRAVGYSFVLDPQNPAAWLANLKVIADAITAMAEDTKTSGHDGGDAREEYGTGIHFCKTIVEQSIARNTGKVVKYFVLVLTDDCQHGTANCRSGDRWVDGVGNSIFGDDGLDAYRYSCPYAPDMHENGFPVWKPHSVWKNLRGILEIGATVVWAAIGNSAIPENKRTFSSWLGTLAAIFNDSSGVLISWQATELNKDVPGTVVHLLNTLVTNASIADELDAEKKRELAIRKTEALMTSAKNHSAKTNGPLQGVSTTIEEAAIALDQLVINTTLPFNEQEILFGRAQPSAENARLCRDVANAANSLDSGEADRAVVVAYRSLCGSTQAPTEDVLQYEPPTKYSRHVLRSLKDTADPYDDKDDESESVAYRSLTGIPVIPVKPTVEEPSLCAISSIDRLLKMATC